MTVNIIDVSGAGVLASGQHIYVESGVYFASGIHVVADVDVIVSSGLWVDGVSGIHVYVESGIYGTMNVMGYYYPQQYWMPFGVDKAGNIIANVSGGHVYVESGVTIHTPNEIIINATTNPRQINSASGGIILTSGSITSIILINATSNLGDMYIGGHSLGHRPYSGGGLRLERGKDISFNIDNIGKVRVFAARSGDRISYVGVDI